MPHYAYRRALPDPTIPFTDGLRTLERTALEHAFRRPLTPDDEAWLKDMTGCETFLDFRTRVFSPHRLVSHDHSLLIVERVHRKGNQERLEFRALLLNSALEAVALVRRRLNRTARERMVDHNALYVPIHFQGQGIASVISQSHEDAWEVAGYETVELLAAELDRGEMVFGNTTYPLLSTNRDGRVFWATQGYAFHPKRGRSNTEWIQSMLRQAIDLAVHERRLDEATGQALTMNIASLDPWDIVGIQDFKRRPIGEEALQMSDWNGYKQLSDQWPGRDETWKKRKRHLLAHPLQTRTT